MMNFGKKMAVGVASAALVASLAGVPAAVATEEPRTLDGGWDRIASGRANNDRIDTALEVAKKAFPKSYDAKVVYIANSTAMIDAAAAGQLTDGSILLVDNNSRTLDVVKEQVKFYSSAKKVIAIGGTGVVPDSTLKAVADGKETGRLGGKDRYETAMAVAGRIIEVEPAKSKQMIVSRPDVAIDALAAGTLDYGPLFFVKDGELPEDVKQWVKNHKVESVIGLGGKSVVPDKALSEATESVISVNPTGVNKDAIAAQKAFEEARALYLGVNSYTSDFVPDKAYGIASSRNPALLNLARKDADLRFEGYRAQAKGVAEIADIVDTAVADLQREVASAIKDAYKANMTWGAFKADTNVGLNGGKAAQALNKLYGSNTATNAKEEWFSFEDKNDNHVEVINGINYSKVQDGTVKDDLKTDKDKIKTYFKDKSEASLAGGVYSHRLYEGYTIKDLVTVGTEVAVLQADVKLFLDQATQNAASMKAAMEDAWAKLSRATGYIRLGGADRFETAAMISKFERSDMHRDFDRVYLANGVSMVDALVAGVFTRGPILLTNNNGTLTDATKDELQQIGQFKYVLTPFKATERVKGEIPSAVAIGGKTAVSDAAAAAAAAELKAGNNKVTELASETLFTKKSATVDGKGLTAGTAKQIVVEYQLEKSLAGADVSVEWQYRNGKKWDKDNTNISHDSAANGKATAELTLQAGEKREIRALLTVKNKHGVIEKQIASGSTLFAVPEAPVAGAKASDSGLADLNAMTLTTTSVGAKIVELDITDPSAAASDFKVNGENPNVDGRPNVTANAAKGKVDVTVTPGTTKFGEYTVTGKVGTKKFSFTFKYKAPTNPTAISKVAATADVFYSDTTGAAAPLTLSDWKAYDKDGVTVADALQAGTAGSAPSQKHGFKIASGKDVTYVVNASTVYKVK